MPEDRRRDIVVPCQAGKHKVRLAGGLRFLARAQCPKCRAAVDPTRRHRLLRFILNLRRPASDHPLDRAVWVLSAAGLLLSVLTAVFFLQFADRWWLATMLLFGPRWLLIPPIILVGVVAGIRDRALLLPLGLSAWLIVGPVMGFQTGWRTLFTSPDPARDLTLVTFNVQDGEGLSAGPQELLAEWGADVVAFQECGGGFAAELYEMEGWHVWSDTGVCVLSRFPIIQSRVMPADVLRRAGGSGLVNSHLLEGDSGPFWLTNVHLGTPRAGLNLIRRGSVLAGVRLLGRDSFLREIEHRQAASFAAALSGDGVVLGDFNAPPESRIYRSEWRGWTNAFSQTGFGIGGTRLSGWIRARIDHVLVDDSWRVIDARLGRDVGSDHLPLVARVRPR